MAPTLSEITGPCPAHPSTLHVFSVGSKVGSLDNASHKASGGNVKIEDRRLEWKTVGRTDARNPNYTPQGGNKKVCHATL